MSSNAEMTGAEIMCEALLREGVTLLFGIPGGAIMPFYHALYQYRGRLRHVLCRHEQGAGHAAEGYARATGKVGVCLGTSGPGATNLVTPIADAWMDGTPLVAITGQVSSALIGTDAFQETDITGITLPITKHNYLVSDARELPRVFREAFHRAATGRPGPVLIDVTKDCQLARVVPEWGAAPRVRMQTPARPTQGALSSGITAAAAMLARAERPLLLAGNGVLQAGASDELIALAEHTGIPVVTTLHGLGAFPQRHPLSLGLPGMHGWVHVNRALQRCDVLLNVGSRFDDRVTGRAAGFAPKAEIIHVDIDPTRIGRTVRADLPIVADAKLALEALRDATPPGRFPGWLAELRALEQKHPRSQRVRRRSSGSLEPQDVMLALNRSFQGRGRYRVVTDVGQHQMWAAQLLEWDRPRTHITSGGAGTMGFAVPAALGVALAHPDETVWVICGDGGFQMTNQELATMRQEGVTNVKIAVMNNGFLGMVRQWQELFLERRYSETALQGPDFSALAASYGWPAATVHDLAGAEAAIEQAWSSRDCVLLDFRVEREANVFPIVPAGQSLDTMLTEAPAAAVAPAAAARP